MYTMLGSHITGVILAGGANRRMGGRMKALLPLSGRPFIDRQLDEMSRLCREVLIVTNEPDLFAPQLDRERPLVRAVRDLRPGSGPLAGMQAAMATAQSDELWVVACDMPFISAAAAETLLELRRGGAAGGCDAAVPRLAGRLQPLHAVYHRRCREIIDRLLEEDQLKMMELLSRLKYAAAEEPAFAERGLSLNFAVNVNTPEDWEQLAP